MKHTQLTADLQEQASLYAAGAMTDSERLEYARHLEEDDCAVCRSEVDELQSAVSLLAFTVPPASPSAGVKARLMEQARNAAPVAAPAWGWFQWITTAVAIASVAVLFLVIRTNRELRQRTLELNGRIAQLEVQLAEQRTTLAMLTSTGVRVVDLAGQGTNVQARGRIFWNQQQKQSRVYVRDLPPLAADRSYQLWFVTKAGRKLNAGVFNTDSNGSYDFQVTVPEEGDLQAAAVTTEPFGGLPQPTGAFALLGAM